MPDRTRRTTPGTDTSRRRSSLSLAQDSTIWDEWVAALLAQRGRDAGLASAASRVSDWEGWVSEARSERLSGAVWAAVRDEGLQAAFPPQVCEELESQWRQSVAASALVHRDVSGIAALLDEAKVPWILLKGPSVADILYSDPGSRPMSDIDILVRPSHFRTALDLLARDGWTLREDMIPEYLKITHAVLIRQAPYVGVLEVHWNLLGTVPLPGETVLWEGIEQMDLDLRRVPVLGAADKALHLALHAVLHHGLRGASHILDISLAFSRLTRVEWETLVRHAVRMDVVEEVLRALDAARGRAGFSPPGYVLTELRCSRPGWLRRRATDLALSDSGGHAAMTLSRLIMMDGWENKARYLDFVLMPPRQWLKRVDSSAGAASYCTRAFSGVSRALAQMLRGR